MRHPVLTVLVRTRVRQDLRKSGVPLLEAIRLATTVDDDVIEAAQSQLPDDGAVMMDAVNLGDGSLIDKLLAFLDSELGKKLIALIRSLLGI